MDGNRDTTATPRHVESCPLCQYRGDPEAIYRHLHVAHRKRRIAQTILDVETTANAQG
jgi:hypothetical protein